MAVPRVYFKQLELGPMRNFIYLIGDPATREAAVVDPGWDVPTILDTLQQDGYRLTRAFVTHYHFDHTQGVPELLEAADVPVYAHRDDQPYLDLPASSLKLLSGGEEVRVGGVPVNLLHTPGHTPGSQCLLVDGKLLSGDTLFIGACGRCDLPGGDARALYESLALRLRRLDDETVLCPGHHYAPAPTARLGQEKRANPFLSSPSLEDFLGLVGG